MFFKELLNYAFRILNFGILIYLFAYIFKNYILKNIKEQISLKNTYLYNLKKRCSDLKERSHELDNEVKTQEQLSQNLLEKVKKWKSKFEQREKEKLQEHVALQQKINENLKIQEENVTLDYIKKDILPEVISNAETKLKKDFELTENVKNYENKLIEFLNKSIQ
jgi:hypothetical protein